MTLTQALLSLGLVFSDMPSISVSGDGAMKPLQIVGNAPWCLFTSDSEVLCVHNGQAACEQAAELLGALELSDGESCLTSDELVEAISE